MGECLDKLFCRPNMMGNSIFTSAILESAGLAILSEDIANQLDNEAG